MANYTYIDADQLVALMDEPDSTQKLAIIDCRDSDREQGFLVGSQHVPTLTATEDTYKKLATALWEEKKTVVVFHCALSQVRGPKGANRFATAQKALGYSLPSVCVLRGGFDGFYEMYAKTRMDLMYV